MHFLKITLFVISPFSLCLLSPFYQSFGYFEMLSSGFLENPRKWTCIKYFATSFEQWLQRKWKSASGDRVSVRWTTGHGHGCNPVQTGKKYKCLARLNWWLKNLFCLTVSFSSCTKLNPDLIRRFANNHRDILISCITPLETGTGLWTR